MTKILITGARGNIGIELIRALQNLNSKDELIAAGHNLEMTKKKLAQFSDLKYRKLDFAKSDTFDKALVDIDIVFLLRPPQLADIPKYFTPFFEAMKRNGVGKIVFLSVQGVENQKMIPHNKIEQLIRQFQFEFAMLRPGYFMQNLTTMLLPEIKQKDMIFIPAGKLKFNWVDTRDIGHVGAAILTQFEKYKNEAYEITGSEFVDFSVPAKLISEVKGRTISYKSPNLIHFFMAKKKQGIPTPMIFVMIMLHYLPRFGKNQSGITNVVKEITGKSPSTLKEFIEREKDLFMQ